MFDFVFEMSAWDRTFFYIGFGASLFFVGQLVLMFFGGDDSGDSDGDSDSDDGATSFKILTLKNIVGFLMGIGWGGLSLHVDGSFSQTVSLVGAVGIGIVIMLLQSSVFYLMYKLHAPNEETLSEAVGNLGHVYLEIPKGGMGKVTINLHGKIVTMNAFADDEKIIPTGAQVEVVHTQNSELIVKEVPYKK